MSGGAPIAGRRFSVKGPVMRESAKGIAAMVVACTIWGLSPLYYKALAHVPAAEVLAHRTLWSALFFLALLGVQRRLPELRAARPVLGRIALAALAISVNWFLFIFSVQSGRGLEASLGYYIFPLVAVLTGVVVFRESLSRAQIAAVALAAGAVVVLTLGLGAAPLIALSLAVTFAIYGGLKKGLSLRPAVSVLAEVLLLAPLALAWLVQIGAEGWFTRDLPSALGLAGSGILTGGPLMLFSYAARRVRMASLGLVQYLNPTLQFLCAALVFGEPVTRWHLIAFALIWTALAIYSAAAFKAPSSRA